ncbi:MAG: type II CAAX endopeptidase family protein [Novosphingobium sp.]
MSEIKLAPGSLPGRMVRHPLSLLVIGFVFFLLLYGLTAVASGSIRALRNTPAQVLITLACAALGVLAYKGFERWIERRDDAEFAVAGAGKELGAGLLIGFVLFSLMVGLVAMLGGFGIEGLRGTGSLWMVMSMAIASGLFEELIFRGIVFRQIEALAGSWVALALTSAFFGAAHLANPGATLFAAFALAMEGGILLGGAYMLTRRLWLASGIHAAWNFTEGWVYATPVSGGKAPAGLFFTKLSGPDWLTGGAFGLEASVAAMAVATGAGVVMLVMAARRGRVVAPGWKRTVQTKL